MVRDEEGWASPPHTLHLIADEQQGQLSLAQSSTRASTTVMPKQDPRTALLSAATNEGQGHLPKRYLFVHLTGVSKSLINHIGGQVLTWIFWRNIADF
jgi:hypothetical protein